MHGFAAAWQVLNGDDGGRHTDMAEHAAQQRVVVCVVVRSMGPQGDGLHEEGGHYSDLFQHTP